MSEPQAPDDALIALAERLADAARAVILRHFRSPVSVDDKPDATPVTVADREAEQTMRALIEEARPDDGIIGEEFGSVRTDADYVWVLDPIDGTKQFITGRPTFGTLIALTHHRQSILGFIDAPGTGERWIGASGRPSLHMERDGTRAEIHTRSCDSPGKAVLCTTSPDMYRGATAQSFRHLKQSVKLPQFGGDCYNYGLLASGFCDIVTDAAMSYYDYAALVPVVEGAGGAMTDWNGKPLGPDSPGQVLALGDPRIQDTVLEILKG
ncbi:histidinol-phosphatase [Ferruginivarius sediminum]|uniref:Histidinol-phosphatase n=1 Tax=Ferruginivarius sediminum TaxID=2661937 RepID=A0A369T5W9_9PROT|nr:histidinol-phosphatase [Ferruginivarius sediminum]RDD60713.1 histidinol-phosphatase [Ferruginivarius sediminum]